MELDSVIAPAALESALEQVRLQNLLCDVTPDNVEEAVEEIKSMKLVKSIRGIRSITNIMLETCNVRPRSVPLLAQLAKLLHERRDGNEMIAEMKHLYLYQCPPKVQILTPLVWMFECNLNGFISDEEIGESCNEFYDTFVSRGYNVWSMLCWFAPIHEKYSPALFKDHMKRIVVYYADAVSHQDSFFLEMFEEMRKENWNRRIELCRAVYMPGSIADIIRRDDIETFQRVASLPGFDWNQVTNETVYEYCSLLWYKPKIVQFAAFQGSTRVFEYLVANGADTKCVDTDGHTLAHMAVGGGHLDVIQRCEEIGCSFDGCLEIAVRTWRFDLFQWLLSSKREEFDELNILHEAAKSNNIEVLLYCLERGCDVNRVMDYQETPLHKAATYGRSEAVHVLLSCKDIIVDARDDAGLTPFATAAQKGVSDVVTAFLEDGRCDINAKAASGENPLTLAVSEGYANIVALLLPLKGLEIQELPGEGSLLHIVVRERLGGPLMRMLVNHAGVDLNAQDESGMTPLHLISQLNLKGKEALDTVTALLEANGLDETVMNRDGVTPFQYAAVMSNFRVMDMLLAKGLDPNIRTKDGRTALHLAAEGGVVDAVEFLTKIDAVDVNALDENMCTPLLSAVSMDEPDVTRSLLTCPRVDAAIRDSDGKTALEMAREQGGDCLSVIEEIMCES